MKVDTLKIRLANFLPNRAPRMLAARMPYTPGHILIYFRQDGLASSRQKNVQTKGRDTKILMSAVT